MVNAVATPSDVAPAIKSGKADLESSTATVVPPGAVREEAPAHRADLVLLPARRQDARRSLDQVVAHLQEAPVERPILADEYGDSKSLVVVGTGFVVYTVKFTELDIPPPGAGLATITL